MSSRPISALPAGTAISRLLICLALAGDDLPKALSLAGPLSDSPQVKGVIAAMTAGASSAGALASYGLDAELLVLINSQSVFSKALAKMRRWPFRVRAPKETNAAGGGWVGMGAPIAVTQAQLSTLVLERYRAAAIVALAQELLIVGDPVAEAAVREVVAAGVGAYIDAQFLDPSVSLAAEVHPASITSGAPSVTSSGTTGDALVADLARVADLVTTDGSGLVWFMKFSVAKKLAAKFTTAGARAFPELNVVTGGSIFGVPVLLSRNVPSALGSPTANLIILADLASIAAAADDSAEISASRVTTIAMDTGPASPSSQVSMFQTNTLAIKAVRAVSWLRAQDNSTAYLDVLAI
jgi:HK97 family phage major capsid protein